MNYLIAGTEVWRVPDEAAADKMEQEFRENDLYDLATYNKAYKEVKVKGQVVETYIQVTAKKVFNNIKDPVNDVSVKYE